MRFFARVLLSFVLAGAAMVLAPGVAHAEGLMVLWWQVGDAEDWSEDGESLKNVIVQKVNGMGETTAYDLGVEAARIRETSTGTYLAMLNPDDIDNPTAASFNLPEMYVPTLWQADVSDFASGNPEYAFVIELGNFESGAWTVLALSETVAYTDLVTSQAVAPADGGYTPHYATPWVAATYTVPEPSSGLMLLVGAALLALRRGKRRAHG